MFSLCFFVFSRSSLKKFICIFKILENIHNCYFEVLALYFIWIAFLRVYYRSISGSLWSLLAVRVYIFELEFEHLELELFLSIYNWLWFLWVGVPFFCCCCFCCCCLLWTMENCIGCGNLIISFFQVSTWYTHCGSLVGTVSRYQWLTHRNGDEAEEKDESLQEKSLYHFCVIYQMSGSKRGITFPYSSLIAFKTICYFKGH